VNNTRCAESPVRAVAIVGGTGFLGRRLARAWVQEGANVTVTSRSPWTPPPSVEHVRWDPAQHAVPASVTGADVVYNLAGENIGASRWSAKKRASLYSSRVDTTRKLVDAFGTATRVLVNASAISAYPGDGRERDEGAPVPLESHASFIQQMTFAWEREALRASPARRVVLPRIGMVIGPEGMLAGLLPLFRARVARFVGPKDAPIPWIGADDAVRLLVFVVQETRVAGSINVTAPTPVSFEEFSACVQRALGVRSLCGIPAWLVRLLLGRHAGALVLARHIAPPRKALACGFRFNVTDIEPAIVRALQEPPQPPAAIPAGQGTLNR
jgi:hypothetical protein